jgi:hypothetical protein
MVCKCHGKTFCPDEICIGYEDDVPIYVRKDSPEGLAAAQSKGFSHPNVGNNIRVEIHGTEVSLHFSCHSPDKAAEIAATFVKQLQEGNFLLRIGGTPDKIVREGYQ